VGNREEQNKHVERQKEKAKQLTGEKNSFRRNKKKQFEEIKAMLLSIALFLCLLHLGLFIHDRAVSNSKYDECGCGFTNKRLQQTHFIASPLCAFVPMMMECFCGYYHFLISEDYRQTVFSNIHSIIGLHILDLLLEICLVFFFFTTVC
jgi:hypothetical protein